MACTALCWGWGVVLEQHARSLTTDHVSDLAQAAICGRSQVLRLLWSLPPSQKLRRSNFRPKSVVLEGGKVGGMESGAQSDMEVLLQIDG